MVTFFLWLGGHLVFGVTACEWEDQGDLRDATDALRGQRQVRIERDLVKPRGLPYRPR